MSSITGLYQCPDCSATITFRSSETTVIICSCGSVLRRKESDNIVSIPVAVIASPQDYIQVGTKGKWKDKKFEITGRFRLWLDESVYNYWTAIFDDGSLYYLAEGYGLYAFQQRILLDITVDTNKIKQTIAGSELTLMRGENSVLHAKDKASKIEVEGELLLPENDGHISTYDYTSYGGRHIQFIEWLTGYLVAYSVEYVSVAELELSGTNNEPLKSRQFKCPSCKAGVEVKTFPYAQSCSCSTCGTRFSLHDASYFTEDGKDKVNTNSTDIPLAAVGTINNIKYEVIGYAKKEEVNEYKSQWKEYVLYNKAAGYAFLSEYDGHWIYLKEQGDTPVLKKPDKGAFEYKQEPFRKFNKYTYRTLDTAGEFPYNMFNDGNFEVYEYISPPEMWTLEKNRREGLTWFHGMHVSRSEMAKQFPYTLPYKNGVGAIEPKGFLNPAKLLKITAIALLVMILLHLIIDFTRQKKVLLDNTYTLQDTAAASTFITDKFELTKWKSNLMFEITAPVSNNWFELNANLVNAKTGEEFAIEQGVESYAGITDGESWQEGSNNEETYLSSIPAGTYFLQLQGSKPAGGVNSFTVKVTYDATTNRTFFVFLLVVLIWPLIKYFTIINNEKRRWYNSPFSPYTYET